MLVVADIALFILHILVILFNLTGWIWVSTRKFHLIFVGITLFSWAILGIWFGFGYCFLTDWHWDVKRQLGETSLPNSFITYLANNTFNLGLSPNLVDWLTGILFILAIGLSVYMNFFQLDFRKGR